MATADPPLTLQTTPSATDSSLADASTPHPSVIPESVAHDIAAESALAIERVAGYLVQVGWSREAATQRAGHLVEEVIDESKRADPSAGLARRQLVRGAMSLAIDSATSATKPSVVPEIQTRPMPVAGQAQRLGWLRLDWWLGRITG